MFRKIIMICLIILLVLFTAGCELGAENIKSEEEAQEAVVDVSEDIANIADTLESINADLG